MLNISNSNTQYDHLIFRLISTFLVSLMKNTKDAFFHSFFCHLSEPDKNEVMKYIRIIKLFHIKDTDIIIQIIGIGNIMVMSFFALLFQSSFLTQCSDYIPLLSHRY